MPRARRTEASRSIRSHWPSVALATLAVTGLPLALVTTIQAAGGLRSALASVAAAAALSMLISAAGATLWKRRRRSRDIVFADLMVWGWIRRLRTERRLSDASELLGERADLTASRRADLLEQLSLALEARDPYTHGHSRRVTRYSEAIARGMGLPREEVARIRTAAAVHDVGKIRTPREVLNKPGRLDDEEFAAVKRHPVDGAEMVAELGDDALTAMVLHHHERLDGRGYPDGLAAEQIPLGARIIAVADTFDAITSTRPYRPGAQHKKALDILETEAGTQLDPAAVTAFLRYYTGERSVAWWSILVAEPPRLVAWLVGWLQGAGAAPLVKGVVAAGATALVGGAIVAPAPRVADAREARAAAVATVQPGRTAGAVRRVLAAAPADGAAEPVVRERAAKSPVERTRPRKRRAEGRPEGRAPRDGRDVPGDVTAGGGGSEPSANGGGEQGGGGSDGGSGGSGSGGGGPDGSTGDGDPGPSDQGVTVKVPELPVVSDVLPVDEVKVPPVKLPPVELPPVEVPAIETPPVEVGPVRVPPVKVPPIKLPPVKLP